MPILETLQNPESWESFLQKLKNFFDALRVASGERQTFLRLP
jgi:hypothetical protein